MRSAALWFALAVSLVAMHEARSSEYTLTKVAVLDTGLDLNDPRFEGKLCASGHRDFTGTGLTDFHGHGTHVAGLIVANAGQARYCLLILKYYTDGADGRTNARRSIEAERYAVAQGATVVNYSGGGPGFREEEYLIIRAASGVLFVVCAGNEGQDIGVPTQEYYPASYPSPNVVVVGSRDQLGHRVRSSNWGKVVTAWEMGDTVQSYLPGGRLGYMSGTSMATAIHTGKVVRALSR